VKRVFAYAAPADLRKGYNGLYGLVVSKLGRDPMDGDIFLFTNRRRTSCKVLHHDGSGLTIFMKRLDRGRFAPLWARRSEGDVQLSEAELALFLEGAQQLGYMALSPASKTSS
jgi:transposase